MHWLPLAEFAYYNSVHASTGVMLFIAEKGLNPSIEATFRAIPADKSIRNVHNGKAQAEKLVELWAAIEQRWKEVTATQWKYADRHIKPHEFEVGDMVWLSGKII